MFHRSTLSLVWFAALLPITGATQPRLDWVASLQGNGNDRVSAIALDDRGNTYLTGSTTSFDLGTQGTYQPQRVSSSLYSFSSATQQVHALFPPTPLISTLAPDARHPGTVYAATALGLLKTTDNGLSWTWLWKDLPSGQRMVSVAVAPSQPDILYVGFRHRHVSSAFLGL